MKAILLLLVCLLFAQASPPRCSSVVEKTLIYRVEGFIEGLPNVVDYNRLQEASADIGVDFNGTIQELYNFTNWRYGYDFRDVPVFSTFYGWKAIDLGNFIVSLNPVVYGYEEDRFTYRLIDSNGVPTLRRDCPDLIALAWIIAWIPKNQVCPLCGVENPAQWQGTFGDELPVGGRVISDFFHVSFGDYAFDLGNGPNVNYATMRYCAMHPIPYLPWYRRPEFVVALNLNALLIPRGQIADWGIGMETFTEYQTPGFPANEFGNFTTYFYGLATQVFPGPNYWNVTDTSCIGTHLFTPKLTGSQ